MTVSAMPVAPAGDAPRPRRGGLGAAAALLALVLGLAACSGEPVTEFLPTRVIAFGDEASVIDSTQRKYTVNGLDANGQIDCRANPLWIQVLAGRWGHVFPDCNPDGLTNLPSRIRAAPGARVADVEQQVAQQLALEGGFSSRDLLTVYVGLNDVLALYREYPGRPAGELVAEARSIGVRLGNLVNQLVGPAPGTSGPRVLLATLIRLVDTPFGRSEASLGADRSDLLLNLVDEFNRGLRTTIRNDGRVIALVQADAYVVNAVANPSGAGLANVVTPACQTTATLPNCNTSTLVPGADPSTWLWADSLQLSSGGHARFGNIAVERATNNPFGS